MKIRTKTKSRDAGFTLLELLVSMTLLALLAALLPASLKIAKRALQITTQISQKTAAVSTRDWIQKTLTEAMPLLENDSEGALRVSFSGEKHSLHFVAPMSGGPRGGGLYRFQLNGQTNGNDDFSTLVLRILPLNAPADNASSDNELAGRPPSRPIEERVLAKSPTLPSYRYFGQAPNDAQSAWHDVWVRTDRLPELVELTTSDFERNALLPPLIIELKLRRRL